MNSKEILQRGNAAIANGNNEVFLSSCTDDTKWVFVGDRTLNGKEEVRKWMTETYQDPPKFIVEAMIADGDFLTAVGRITLKGSGDKDEDYAYCDVWRFEGDKIAELKAFVIKD